MDLHNFFDLIESSTSPFHSVVAASNRLLEAGYERIQLKDKWDIKKGHRYFLDYHGSTLFAFSIGEDFEPEDGYRIATAHGDFPGFRLKPNAGLETDGYLQLNTEGYGGANRFTWLDRPLSVAGRVVLKTENTFAPEVKLVDFKKPILMIPSLAVHLDPNINKGVELRRSVELLPLYGTSSEETDKELFINYLASHLDVDKEDILDYELTIYNAEKPTIVGVKDEFVLSPRLDNLTSLYAILAGLINGNRRRGINMIAVFDHEEIGSRSKQGAASLLLPYIVEKIYKSLGYIDDDYRNALEDSLLMSVDVGHGYHPNYGSKYDHTNRNVLGEGLTIKEACAQSYATDSEAIGIVQQICHLEGIPYQKFANHSDLAGGSTLGSIVSTVLPVRTVDIGIPLLGMHSSNEVLGIKDQESIIGFMKAYFSL